MKLKQLFDKIGKMLIAFLFSISSGGINILLNASPVFAADTVLKAGDTGVSETQHHKWAVHYSEGVKTHGRPDLAPIYNVNYFDLKMRGEKVYCVQPDLNTAGIGETGANAIPYMYSPQNWTSKTAQKLGLIATVGYGFNGDKSQEMDWATQVRIWQELKPGKISSIPKNIQAKIDVINKRLTVLDKNVSFDTTPENISFENGQYVVELDDFGTETKNCARLKDAAKVSSEYTYELASGSSNYKFKKDGNDLIVWAVAPTDGEFTTEAVITAKTKGYQSAKGTSILYKTNYYGSETSQRLALLKSPGTKDKSFTIHVKLDIKPETDAKVLTTASSNGEKDVEADIEKETTTITDRVAYRGLFAGRKYTVKGTLMDKATGKPMLDKNDQPIEAVKTFVPTMENTPNGTVDVEFVVDTDTLKGRTVVVFEELIRVTPAINPDNNGEVEGNVKIAEHKDIEDEGQTVVFRNPSVGTKAKIDGETQVINTKDKEVQIVDTVSYKGLKPGKEYTMKAHLMDKATGQPIEGYEAVKVFTPKEADGTVEVVFDKVNPKDFTNMTFVVFEKLANENGVIIAHHEDIEDEGQTLEVVEASFITKGSIQRVIGSFDEGANKIINTKDKKIVLTDIVKYEGLIPGRDYTLHGTLVDKATGEPVKGISASKTFKPEKANGEVTVSFAFNAKDIAGKTVVVFERLVDEKDDEVSKEENIENPDQTVEVKDASIGTSAQIDEKKIVHTKKKTVELVDTVSYKGLIVGETYTMTGKLMDKSTGKVFESDAVKVQIVDKTKEYTAPVQDEKPAEKAAEEGTKDAEGTADKAQAEDKGTVSDSAEKAASAVKSVKNEAAVVKTDKNTSATRFIPSQENGNIEVKFTIDLSKVKDKDLVVYEKLFDKFGDEVAKHEDIKDEKQTVTIKNAKIQTKATIKGTKQVVEGGTYELIDTVSYQDLIPGKKYVMEGRLMDKSTGKELDPSAVKAEIVDMTKDQKPADGTINGYFDSEDIQGGEVSAPKAVNTENGKQTTSQAYSVSYTAADKSEYTVRVSLDATAIKNRELGKDFIADIEVSGPNTAQNGSYRSVFSEDMMTAFQALGEKRAGESSVDRMKALNEFLANAAANRVSTQSTQTAQNNNTKATNGSTSGTAASQNKANVNTVARTTFIPEKSDGTIQMKFTVDTSKLAGKSVVVFEKLFDEENDEVAKHEDINDQDQTVVINHKANVHTGINAGIGALALAGAAAAIGLMATRRKKQR